MNLLDNNVHDWDLLCSTFKWEVPEYYNIAYAVCDKHRGLQDRIALYYENDSGHEKTFTFGDLKRLSNQLANTLNALGAVKGDRIAIILSQRPEAAISHLAIFKLGCVALPLSVLFGPDASGYRLQDSAAKIVITDGSRREMVESLKPDLPDLEAIIDCDDGSEVGFWGQLARGSNMFQIEHTLGEDPALLIYTSGTTGPPKGALVAHRCFPGNLTGFELSHNFLPQAGDVFWTPADWAWTGGLIDGLLPAWYYGVPVLGYEGGKFDPEKACRLMAKYRIRNTFIPPTALKMIRQLGDVRGKCGVNLRTLMSAGEAVGAELYHWGKDALGIEINEMCSQTEFNYIIGNCSAIMEVKPGSPGKAYPGHRIEPVDDDGNVMATGEIGELAAFRHGDPVMFLGYWRNEAATKAKFIGDWWGTGDMGYRDSDGYLWFVGRQDDVISSAGYRIGPGEIEDCLLKHPAVAQAAVIGSPNDLRGEIIKAFIVPAPDTELSEDLKKNIQESVRSRLAAYEYPREIEFINELPMTTTGKVRRMELRQREIAKKGGSNGTGK